MPSAHVAETKKMDKLDREMKKFFREMERDYRLIRLRRGIGE